jgi:hypothetical protein
MPTQVATGRLLLELRFRLPPEDGSEPRSTDVAALLAGLAALYDASFHAAVGDRPVEEAAYVADQREAELHAERAMEGLEALRDSRPPFELEAGRLTIGE